MFVVANVVQYHKMRQSKRVWNPNIYHAKATYLLKPHHHVSQSQELGAKLFRCYLSLVSATSETSWRPRNSLIALQH